ncbi:MAG TPA: TonB-dependent receptor [Chryseosolibacter sp.]
MVLSGVITDSISSETLPGASVHSDGTGVISNKYGFFSLRVPGDAAKEITVTYVGYSSLRFKYSARKDSTVRILLHRKVNLLDEVSVAGDSETYAFDLGKITIPADKILSMASFAGEPDVLKSLQLLPGVQSGNEGTTNLSVRGGGYDQNLILLDEAPVYNPAHSLSFFSIFNIDAIQGVDFYKGNIPVRYGGRLSSVVDTRMKEGNRNKKVTTGSVGLISSRLTNEGPLWKNGKWSYVISGRYSYAGHIVNATYFLGQKIFNDKTANRSRTNNRINFFDLNGKINFSPNEKNKFFISSYAGHDRFDFSNITSGHDLAWGNRTLTTRWNHVFTKRLFVNTSLIASSYKYKYQLLNSTQYFKWTASLDERQLKQDYDWYLNDKNFVTFGFAVQNNRLAPGMIEPRNESSASSTYRLEDKRTFATGLYLSNTSTPGNRFRVTYGLRYTNFGHIGERTVFAFPNGGDKPVDSTRTSAFNPFNRFEPRVSVSYTYGKSRIGLSYDRTVQFFHLLANSSVGLPTDIWWPSSKNIKPALADILAGSYETNLASNIKMHYALYYKYLSNVTDFRDNARLFINKYVDSQLLQGTGTAYGAEFQLEKTKGRFTGLTSYTYSKTFNKIEGINNGQRYPNRYDKRHNLSTSVRYTISRTFELSSNFVLTSGGAVTVPVGSFTFGGVSFNSYSTRNNYRLQPYHRLDVSLKYRKSKSKKTSTRYWSLDIYNVYARKNPFSIYSLQQDYGFVATNTYGLYLFGVVPALSYNFQF